MTQITNIIIKCITYRMCTVEYKIIYFYFMLHTSYILLLFIICFVIQSYLLKLLLLFKTKLLGCGTNQYYFQLCFLLFSATLKLGVFLLCVSYARTTC